MSQSRLIDFFFELVRIPSPSRDEKAMAECCLAKFNDLGFVSHCDNSEVTTGSNTGNVIAYLPGNTPGQVVFSAHLDTVGNKAEICPVIERGIIRSKYNTILSADDKAGVAAIYEGIRRAIENKGPRPAITVLLTTCEEKHLRGSSALASTELPAGAPCYVLDADGAPGTIIIAAPCHYALSATFYGCAAHAGVEPEAGVSAIEMAALGIMRLELGWVDSITTATIGTIAGGSASNVIPHTCRIEGECRSLKAAHAQKVQAKMTAILEGAAKQFGGRVDITWTCSYGAIQYEENDQLVQGIVRAAQAAGISVGMASTGGGSDANILAEKGVRPVALGIGMTNFHSTDEHITVADLENTALLVEKLVEENARPAQQPA